MKKSIFFFGILIPMLFINPALAQSPFNYYLHIDGIDGDSMAKPQAPGRPIDVFSFKEGITLMGTMAFGGGGGAGKAQFADMSFTKRIDRASVKLKIACTSGQHIKQVILVCALKGGSQQEIYRVTLTDVMVTGVKFSADHLGALEEVTFNYSKIEWQFWPLRPDGSRDAPIKGGYDMKMQKKV